MVTNRLFKRVLCMLGEIHHRYHTSHDFSQTLITTFSLIPPPNSITHPLWSFDKFEQAYRVWLGLAYGPGVSPQSDYVKKVTSSDNVQFDRCGCFQNTE